MVDILHSALQNPWFGSCSCTHHIKSGCLKKIIFRQPLFSSALLKINN